MNSPDAWLVYQLLKDYHETVAPALKVLRRETPGLSSDPSSVEVERVKATGWFNHVASLYLHGLIDAQTFRTVASPAGAKLWVEYVVPLDREIRRSAHGDEAADGVPMVEQFWREYAQGKLVTRQFIFGPPTMTDQAAGVAH